MRQTYELGNGNYARLGEDGGITIYNEDNIVCLNARQTASLKDAFTDWLQSDTATEQK